MEGKYGLRLSTFDLFKGFKPADQAHEFCISHCLSEGHRNVIFAKLCEVVGCARGELLIWRKWVEVSVRAVGLEVKEGGGSWRMQYSRFCNRLVCHSWT